MDLYLFAEGNHRDLSSCLGRAVENRGWRRRVCASPCGRRMPGACRWSATSTSGTAVVIRCACVIRPGSGSCSSRACKRARLYKYEILGQHGILPLKADPMALATSLPPDTASKVAAPLQIDWQDQDWMSPVGDRQKHSAPLSIYELHAGSWQCDWTIWEESGAPVHLAELAEPDSLRQGTGFHPHRTDADHGAPVRWFLGLSVAVAVRTERAVWHPGEFASSSTPATRPRSA
jgi:1,4-alpha-glucan branching enzyme